MALFLYICRRQSSLSQRAASPILSGGFKPDLVLTSLKASSQETMESEENTHLGSELPSWG